MATERQADIELILVFIEHVEALERFLRQALDRLEYALFVQGNRADEHNPQPTTLQPTPVPVPREPRFPILPGDIPNRDVLHARFLVCMLRLVMTMRGTQAVLSCFERAMQSVQDEEEEEERRGQQLEGGDRDADND